MSGDTKPAQDVGVLDVAVVALTEINKLAKAPISRAKLLMVAMDAIASLSSDALAALNQEAPHD